MIDGFWTGVVLVLHGLAAGGVTAHVLLNQQDVRSSIGWIGLVWLSPFIGSSIYLAFGINRVGRRGARVPIPGRGGGRGHLAAGKVLPKGLPAQIVTLARAGDTISGMPLVPGNRFSLLSNGDEAYPAMIEAIEGAERTIALATYIFADDSCGRAIADALIDAHRRGVVVRVLIDGIGGGYFVSRIVTRLRQGGVPVERFLHEWLPWQMPFINLRNHKKILVVDGRCGFTGGMNISERNMGGEELPNVQDVMARIEGPVVQHLLLSFAADWAFTTQEELAGENWWPELTPLTRGHVMRGLSSGPDEGIGRVETLLASAVEQAEKSVRIVTPYFLPEDRLMAVLRRAAMRGVKVEILVPNTSNHFYVDWAMAAHLAHGAVEGMQVFFMPEPFDHSKLMTVDGLWATLGSANWDARSMRLNFEFMLECFGKTAVRKIDTLIDQKKERARELDLRDLHRRPLPVRLRDASLRLMLPYL